MVWEDDRQSVHRVDSQWREEMTATGARKLTVAFGVSLTKMQAAAGQVLGIP